MYLCLDVNIPFSRVLGQMYTGDPTSDIAHRARHFHVSCTELFLSGIGHRVSASSSGIFAHCLVVVVPLPSIQRFIRGLDGNESIVYPRMLRGDSCASALVNSDV